MYKLVVVAGKLRGQEFELEEGDNLVGREDECDIRLDVDGVSKKHLTVTVTGDTCYIRDLESANGTFLNGDHVKTSTVKNGDNIALPDLIIQVVFVQEKKIIIKRKSTDADDDTDPYDNVPMPDSLPQKLLYIFRYKFMPLFHGINEEYEWRSLIGIAIVVFILITTTLTIFPILQESKKILLQEVATRGAHYAEQIGRLNAKALEAKKLDQVDSNFLDNESGVQSYELFDLEGRVVRPIERMNDYISDSFSVFSRDKLMDSNDYEGKITIKKILEDNTIGIAKKIMAYNTRIGSFEPVGIIAIRFAPKSLAKEGTKNSKAYLESIMTSLIIGVFFFGVIYYLTTRHFDDFRFQMEEALRGKKRNIDNRFLMKEINPLKNSVNSILQRMRELQNEEVDDFSEQEGDESYVSTLYEFMQGAGIPAMILDSQKNLKHINLEAEDLCGIRESVSKDENFLDVAREQGMAATIIDLCEQSATNSGTSQSSDYEFGGSNHHVYVTSLIGKDSFAKGFYITFVKEE